MGDALTREFLPFAPIMEFKPAIEYKLKSVYCADGVIRDRVIHSGGIADVNLGSPSRSRLARAWYRAQKEGRITVGMADEICIGVLGRHPTEVFGEAWFE